MITHKKRHGTPDKNTGDSPTNSDDTLYKPCNDAIFFFHEDDNAQKHVHFNE